MKIYLSQWFIVAISIMVAFLELLKKIILEPFFLWLYKKITGKDELPKWINFLTINVLAFLLFCIPFVEDGILTLEEIILIIQYLCGINFTFWGAKYVLKK